MKSILIVEDVDTMRSLLEQTVSGIQGFKVSGVAGNVWEAHLELGRRRPDLVLLDEVLPGESSVDLLAEIFAEGIPTLLITGMEDPSHAIPAEAIGRITKPSWNCMEEDRVRFNKAISGALGIALSG